MDGWTDRWTDGRTDEWTDRWTDWMNVWMDGWTEKLIDELNKLHVQYICHHTVTVITSVLLSV